MGSYKLWEQSPSREAVYKLTEQVVEEMAKENQTITKQDWAEPSQALVYGVWAGFWHHKNKVVDTTRPPFTHRVEGMSVIDALRKAGDVEKYYSPSQVSLMSRTIGAILSRSMLVKRVGGPRSEVFYVREWPEGFVPRYYAPHANETFSKRDRTDLDRQDKKAKELAGEVKVHYDITKLKTPEANPESVMAFIAKLVPIAKRLQEENESLKGEKALLEAKLAEIEKDGWREAVDVIQKELAS